MCIRDSIGCNLGGERTEIGGIVINNLKHLNNDSSTSTIFGCKKTNLFNAVFINSNLVNVLDFDDTYIGHSGATIVPVALNVGEYLNSSGKELITAVGLACELMIRIGLGLRSSEERKYVHGHGLWQVFEAVIIVAKLLKLNYLQIANAIAIAGSNAPIPSVMKTVYGSTGPTMSKNNYGIASQVGVISAFLAKNGFTGPQDIFEGETGFWKMIGTDNNSVAKEIDSNFNIDYEILKVAFKPYPCCRLIHSYIDAITNIIKEKSIDLTQIKTISVKTIKPPSKYPFKNNELNNINEGQFSVPYVVSCAVIELNHRIGIRKII